MRLRGRILGTVALLILLGVTALLVSLGRSADDLSVSFLEYTNDPRGLRQYLYRLANTTDLSIALFRIDNHTSRRFDWCGGVIELRTQGRWVADTNQLPVHLGAAMLEPRSNLVVRIPTPAGEAPWRCLMNLRNVKPRHYFPDQIAEVVNRWGIPTHDKIGYKIYTAEIQR